MIRRTLLTFLAASFVGLAPLTSAAAREWFVAPSPLGLDSNPGTAEQPFATINRGAAVAQAGDTVWIRPGTYLPTTMIKPANSGTAAAPIVFRAQSGGEVIIDGQLRIPNYSWDAVFWIDRKNWITVDGLRVINSAWFGISANDATGVTVQNCSTRNTYASGIYIRASSQIKVWRNTVQRACVHPLTTPLKDTQECISLAGVTEFEVAHNTVFDRREDTNNGGEGIDTKGACRNGTVHHNHVYDLVRLGIYCDAYGSVLENVEIYANTVHHTSSGIVVACENGGTARGVNLHNNVIHDCPRLGLRLAGYLLNGPIQDVQIEQNTVVRCGFGPSSYENSALLVEADHPANRNFVVRYNLFSGNANTIRTKSQGYLTIDRNLLHGPSVVSGANAITADPRFRDSAANDFRLTAGSPAIDAAVGPGGSRADRDDRLRPVDGNGDGIAVPDLGAYEWSPATPQYSLQPMDRVVLPGAAFLLQSAATGDDLTYQWLRNGVAVPGETTASFFRATTIAADAGTYTVRATNPVGTTLSTAATVTFDPAASRAVNLSCRTQLAAGDVLISGFHVSGTGRKSVLIRAVGPGLAAFGVAAPLSDPQISVFRATTGIAANDDWNPAALGDAFTRLGAFPLPAGSKDAAALIALEAGRSYSVHVTGAGGGGAVLLEIYDADPATAASTARLGNVSVRGRAGMGEAALIVGIVVSGTGGRPFLLRGGGPALAAFGVSGALSDPKLELFDGSRRSLLTNDDWERFAFPAQLDQVRQLVGGFAYAPGGKDAAALATLVPGAYTVQITGTTAGPGEVLAEIYEAP